MIPGYSVGMSSAYSYRGAKKGWRTGLELVSVVIQIFSWSEINIDFYCRRDYQFSTTVIDHCRPVCWFVVSYTGRGRAREGFEWKTCSALDLNRSRPDSRITTEETNTRKKQEMKYIELKTWIVVVEEEEYEILSISIQDQTRKERMISGSDNTV